MCSMLLFIVYFPSATPASSDPTPEDEDESPPSYRSAVM